MSEATEQTSAAPTPEEQSAPKAAPKKAVKKNGLWVVAIVLLLVVAGAALKVFDVIPGSSEGEGIAKTDPSDLVANVNGVPVTRGELDKKIEQVKSTLPEGAGDPSADASFELQLLDEVVNLKLLVAAAKEKGFVASEEDITKEVTALTQAFGGPEEFEKQLAANGLTQGDLRENMHNELLIRQLVDAETAIKSVTVTDAEIKATYDEVMSTATPDQPAPPLEEVSEMIKAQLLQQKSAEIVQAYIDALRASAKIEILL